MTKTGPSLPPSWPPTFSSVPRNSGAFCSISARSLFEGLACDITEYGIGLDVLGRDPGFDPQQDALVRVDTHHLRKRLKEYDMPIAEGEHRIAIILPSGQYAPQFIVGQASGACLWLRVYRTRPQSLDSHAPRGRRR